MANFAWARDGRTGPVRRFRQQAFFALEGLIVDFDERATVEDCTIIFPDEFLDRAVSLYESRGYRGKTRCEIAPAWWQDYDELTKMTADIAETVKEAKAMGDPSDPQVQAYWARHKRRSSIRVGGATDAAGYPSLPAPSRDKTPRTTVGGRERIKRAMAAAGGKTVHRPPQRLPRSSTGQRFFTG